MKSVCTHHYPQIAYRNSERMLWNPVMKKPAVNLPEERVRLRFVEALLHESTVSQARIATEKGLYLGADQAGRTDILCYDRTVQPLLLVECKNEKIRLDEAAALQIGRYNYQIQAPFMVLTNGSADYWFRRDTHSVLTGLDNPPESIIPGNKSTTRNAEYWMQRGFLGRETDNELQNGLVAMLEGSFVAGGANAAVDAGGADAANNAGANASGTADNAGSSTSDAADTAIAADVRYLNIPPSKSIPDLAHYYHILSWPDEKLSIGTSCIATRRGATLIVAVAVQNGEPLALLEVRPSLMGEKGRPNAFMHARETDEHFDITGKTGWTINPDNPDGLRDLAEITKTLLSQYQMLTP
ncbi:MAG: type I restriction enzyme HsdR N-terminal domain-containing protein [Rhodothermaceae bacterium]|nr:type I restriction enzyme HsdR N-terminal domain-containing protein [Rhodothermaceae bacterium]